MKKYLVMVIALLAVVAVALPSFALELKYGGMFRARLQSNDNVADGNDEIDDNGNWIDQRLRMYFTFVSSENLQVVTKWEADTLWGRDSFATVRNADGTGTTTLRRLRHGGGFVGADAVNLEMKNAYLDFAIPNTPVRVKTGVQGIGLLDGWIVSDDFSAAVADATFAPIKVTLGYIAAQNEDVTSEAENVDDWFISIDYAEGPFKASLIGFYQYGHDTNVSIDPGLIGNAVQGQPFSTSGGSIPGLLGDAEDNHLFDLGISLSYKDPLWSAYINFVKNLGGVDDSSFLQDDIDYEGWMVEAGGNLYCGPFTFTLFGFVTSGDEIDRGADSFFRYPAGVSHYWSEIMGLGTLDVNVAGSDRVVTEAGYASADHPSNLWTISVGAAWQALEGTKLTLNYYYIGTVDDVFSDLVAPGVEMDSSVGHEIDFYLDQKVVDKLSLRLVAAYLIADDAYTVFEDDDDAYELGAQLLWSF